MEISIRARRPRLPLATLRTLTLVGLTVLLVGLVRYALTAGALTGASRLILGPAALVAVSAVAIRMVVPELDLRWTGLAAIGWTLSLLLVTVALWLPVLGQNGLPLSITRAIVGGSEEIVFRSWLPSALLVAIRAPESESGNPRNKALAGLIAAATFAMSHLAMSRFLTVSGASVAIGQMLLVAAAYSFVALRHGVWLASAVHASMNVEAATRGGVILPNGLVLSVIGLGAAAWLFGKSGSRESTVRSRISLVRDRLWQSARETISLVAALFLVASAAGEPIHLAIWLIVCLMGLFLRNSPLARPNMFDHDITRVL